MTSDPLRKASDALDLSACAREPIHIPGTIQPHGALLVLDPRSLVVTQRAISQPRLRDAFGEVLDQPLEQIFDGALARLRPALLALGANGTSYLGTFTLLGDSRHHAVAHRADDMIQLELEETVADEPGSLEDLYPLIRAFMTKLGQAPNTLAMCELAAQQVRQITGLDRVLIYRFDENWNGTVIAEERNERLPSYLDLRFPADDIPAQARELYRLNRLRLIGNCNDTPVPVEPTLNPRNGRPIDMSLSVLRSVSPVHLQYMRNMGTGASMSISLLREGELWGLISCHHRDPKRVPYHVRTACDFMGQVLSLQLSAKERTDDIEQRVRRRAIQARLLTQMAGEEDFLSGLEREPEQLLALTEAGGAAIIHRERCILVGQTPSRPDVLALVDWLHAQPQADELHTHELSRECPETADHIDVAAGLLAISISQMHASYVLWFRPEVVQTVRWGGNPRKQPIDGRLNPRTSFEAWKETVRRRSLPWTQADIDAALDLRTAIVDIVLRKAEEMAELNEQLVRSNKELEAFSYSVSHDLRAPFRHIVGYSELLLDSADPKLSDKERHYVDTIIESANAAGALVDNLLSFSQMGRSTLGKVHIDMNRLVGEVRQQLAIDTRGRDVQWRIGELPEVDADPMMLRLALQNLFSNAIKFTRDMPQAQITVDCQTSHDEHIFRVADNGCGFDMRYVGKLFGVFQRLHHTDEFEGTGIGLDNVRRIMERHGGRTWAEGQLGKGATIYFTLPVDKSLPT